MSENPTTDTAERLEKLGLRLIEAAVRLRLDAPATHDRQAENQCMLTWIEATREANLEADPDIRRQELTVAADLYARCESAAILVPATKITDPGLA
jgi:hypothetical protein